MVLNIDIKDFFPSIHFGRVRGLFKKMGANDEISIMLANIVCKDGCLVQGSPVSPIISNLVCNTLDKKLLSYARKKQVSITRYADDITISANSNRPDIAKLVDQKIILDEEIVQIIESNSFTINPEKVKLMNKYTSQSVTGLIVNKKVNITKQYKNELRQLVYKAKKQYVGNVGFGSKDHEEKIKLSKVIKGKIAFALDILTSHNKFIQKIINQYNEVFVENKFTHLFTTVDVFTEGKLDVEYYNIHMKNMTSSEYNFGFRQVGYSCNKGSIASSKDYLLKRVQLSINKITHNKTVFIFDCDAKKEYEAAKKCIDENDTTGNLYALLLPKQANPIFDRGIENLLIDYNGSLSKKLKIIDIGFKKAKGIPTNATIPKNFYKDLKNYQKNAIMNYIKDEADVATQKGILANLSLAINEILDFLMNK